MTANHARPVPRHEGFRVPAPVVRQQLLHIVSINWNKELRMLGRTVRKPNGWNVGHARRDRG